ncbi:MAG TPA: amino acid adenylation domain-containing protein, partial [Anaerolineae bacterium]|nr:amino acid adenylation domain-containing protein [Anaerolineae bacterium]
AHLLRAQGIEDADRVGICLPRSFEMVVAVLAILKAGATYVPLDPAYPNERLAYMLATAEVSLIVSDTTLVEQLPVIRPKTLLLDQITLSNQPSTPLQRPHTPDKLVYIIFTSGSTGQPKGVMLPHRALVNLMQWQRQHFHVGGAGRTLQFASLSFDVHCQEIFSTWWDGGTLILVDDSVRQDTQQLVQLLAEKQVERLFLPFVALQQIAEIADQQPDLTLSLHDVVSAGEQLQITHYIRNLFARLDNCALHNQYGPSETHVVTAHTLTGDPTTWPHLPPIGKPISNTQLYVLDKWRQPVPTKAVGDLYIAGVNLATGYMGQPQLSAERFINLFDAPAYATGDLAHYQADGTLKFLGRKDSQVKVRGYRIELGEIATILSQHQAIATQLVNVRTGAQGDKMLVAYLVPTQQAQTPTHAELKQYLQQWLPSYMIPRYFVWLETMPLTATGKIDQRALPIPDQSHLALASEFVAPHTALEQKLAAIWCEVLSLERVGVHDDFFALGGHSLLATQIVSRIRATLAVELPLRQLFERPTVAGLATFLQGEKEQLRLIAPPLLPMERGDYLPLSFSQERLWFLAQLQPDSVAYNLPVIVEVHDELDTQILAQALQLLVQRHEILRTTFVARNGVPQQIVADEVDLALQVIACEEARIDELIADKVLRPFNLASGPLLRTTVLQIRPHYQILILDMHHIINDGWSINILLDALTANYTTLLQGKIPEQPPLPIQFLDYAIWQRNWLQGDVLAEQLAYWKTHLAHTAGILNLPTDYPRPPIQTFKGASAHTLLPDDLIARLEKFTQTHNVTIFMTLLAAYNVLLWHYSEQDDIVVGSPIAGRQQQETEQLIGMFINTLALRTQLDVAQSFNHLLTQVRETTLGAYAYQDVPLATLLNNLSIERSLSRSPLFQAAFVLQNTPDSAKQPAPALQIQPYPDKLHVAQFDLTLNIIPRADGWYCDWVYSSDLFAPATIERMGTLFINLLDSLITHPDTVLANVPVLEADKLASAQELALFDQWNDTDRPFPSDHAIAQVFEQQVERDPTAPALVFAGVQLSYGEMNARANQLAHKLIQLGISAETIIPIYLDRSFDPIIAMLAINKAGGSYLPLDSNMPTERIRYMLADCAAEIVITNSQLKAQLPPTEAKLVLLDGAWQQTLDTPTHTPPVHARADSVAYVMYTSGSTGRPKGVRVTQQGVIRLVKNTTYMTFAPSDRVLQIGTLTFDASTWEIWSALLNGASLYIYPSTPPDLALLARFIEEQQLTNVLLTAGLFHQIVDHHLAHLHSLRYLLAGGDVLSVAHIERVRAGLPHTTMINVYGPTENATFTTCYCVPKTGDLGASLSIGRAIANTKIYILDHQLRRVAIGVTGQLYTSGAGLAPGDLNRPALTEQYFIDHPFLNDGSKLYATGDLARFRPNGDIEFLGRQDNQIKLRGFRIEMDEIEHALGQHPAIGAHLVIVHKDDNNDKALIAYLVAQAEPTPTRNELATYLQQWLPSYMIPRHFVWLDAFPLTHNGKVDRRALPTPTQTRPELANEFVAPHTPLEQQLATIWSALLGLEQIGIHDDFFSLGGHSLLVMRLLAKIQDQLNVRIRLVNFYQHPTIAQLVALIDSAESSTDKQPIPRIPRDGLLPLSFAQQRIWFLDQYTDGDTAYNMPLALRLEGDLAIQALEQSVNLLLKRHEILRTTYHLQSETPFVKIQAPSEFSLPIVAIADENLLQPY